MNNNLHPKIYVACLAAYNDGYLHGCWIDATQDKTSVYQEIYKMLADSPIPNAEEWAIHDYEDFGSVEMHEYSEVEFACEMAQFIQEYGELGAAVIGYYGDGIENAKKVLRDHYHGAWGSEFDYATELFDDIYAHEIPKNILFYIDYEKFAYDLFINDYFSLEADGKTHVFSNH